MDYKKEYEAMVQRARELHEGGNALTKLQMEIVCPELEGSEDERIRAEIVEFLLNGIWVPTEISRVKESQRYAKWIAYLEKQKEQKPKEDKDAIEPTPKQDYSGLTDFERAIHRGFLCAGVENVPVEIIKETARECIEDAPLSKEGIAYELFKNGLITNTAYIGLTYPRSEEQSHWKPSEEQFTALRHAADVLRENWQNMTATILLELYNDLKKL